MLSQRTLYRAGYLLDERLKPGVPPAEQEHILDRFYRAAGARTLTGLGPAIVRQVAEAHGRSVDVDTASGGRAVFTLRLPIVVSAQNRSRASSPRPRSGRNG